MWLNINLYFIDEGVPSETEEERKLEAAKAARVKQLTSKQNYTYSSY